MISSASLFLTEPGLERLEKQQLAGRLVGVEQQIDQVRIRDLVHFAVQHLAILQNQAADEAG